MRLRQPRLGIALGSGSARGWAHIGILRALEEQGIVPDIVAGASIGALVGAAHAAGGLFHHDRFGQFFDQLFRRATGGVQADIRTGRIQGRAPGEQRGDFVRRCIPGERRPLRRGLRVARHAPPDGRLVGLEPDDQGVIPQQLPPRMGR